MTLFPSRNGIARGKMVGQRVNELLRSHLTALHVAETHKDNSVDVVNYTRDKDRVNSKCHRNIQRESTTKESWK